MIPQDFNTITLPDFTPLEVNVIHVSGGEDEPMSEGEIAPSEDLSLGSESENNEDEEDVPESLLNESLPSTPDLASDTLELGSDGDYDQEYDSDSLLFSEDENETENSSNLELPNPFHHLRPEATNHTSDSDTSVPDTDGSVSHMLDNFVLSSDDEDDTDGVNILIYAPNIVGVDEEGNFVYDE